MSDRAAGVGRIPPADFARAGELARSGSMIEVVASLQMEDAMTERYEVIVIGAGQAGLSVGYHLARQGLRFVILDGGERIGDSWRRRSVGWRRR